MENNSSGKKKKGVSWVVDKLLMMHELCKIENLLFCLLCFVSIFFYSHHMTDTYIVPKWCFTFLVLLVAIFVLPIKKLCNKIIRIDVVVFGYIIVLITFCQAIYGIGQWFQWIPSIGHYKMVGSFDNPAGFASCLCIGFPFVALCLKLAKDTLLRVFLCLLASIIILAVILSESRTGIMSIWVVVGIYYWHYVPLKRRTKTIVLTGAFFLLLGVSYFLKKDSADGRLLIWKCSWEMIKDSPVYGHGINSFRTHYMDYQAHYFEQYPDSKYSMLADNVLCPFNEYLAVLVNFGLLGFFILLAFIFFLLFCYYKQPGDEKRTALLSLLSVGVFSLFSYPFTYPFVWIIVCFDIYILLKRVGHWVFAPIYKKSLCVILIIFCLGFSYRLYQRIEAEYRWNDVAYLHATDETLSIYQSLIPILGNNPYFLYSYAVILFENNSFEESFIIAQRCRKYWANYELEILLGDICKNTHIYQKAEEHYLQASMMCPCRFYPLNLLYDLYQDSKNMSKALAVAKKIVSNPVKVKSLIVLQIKYKMKQALLKAEAKE